MRLPAYSASAKVICFIEKLGDWCPGILPNQEVFFRISLDTLDTLVLRVSRDEAPESNTRYRFDYPRLTQDIQRIRQGVQDYLSPSRAQPRDSTELVGEYRLDTPSAESSP
ncbi:conjugal transfer protein [Pseudomonas sp. WS 5079]|nr:conjugal transfer protein [Pseudomonas sp. WS 5079]